MFQKQTCTLPRRQGTNRTKKAIHQDHRSTSFHRQKAHQCRQFHRTRQAHTRTPQVHYKDKIQQRAVGFLTVTDATIKRRSRNRTVSTTWFRASGQGISASTNPIQPVTGVFEFPDGRGGCRCCNSFQFQRQYPQFTDGHSKPQPCALHRHQGPSQQRKRYDRHHRHTQPIAWKRPLRPSSRNKQFNRTSKHQ